MSGEKLIRVFYATMPGPPGLLTHPGKVLLQKLRMAGAGLWGKQAAGAQLDQLRSQDQRKLGEAARVQGFLKRILTQQKVLLFHCLVSAQKRKTLTLETESQECKSKSHQRELSLEKKTVAFLVFCSL